MSKISAVFLAGVLFSGGCQWNQGPEELERLVKEDPAFKTMIAQRDQARLQIASAKDDLLKRKKIMDAQIDKIRGEHDLYAKAQNRKIDQWRASIDANRVRLKNEIDSAQAQIEARQAELDSYEKTLVDVQKVLKESKGITLSEQEKKKWQERVLMLTEKIRPLSDEMQELRLEIRLKKQKIGHLD